jgi:hypothetical protein
VLVERLDGLGLGLVCDLLEIGFEAVDLELQLIGLLVE